MSRKQSAKFDSPEMSEVEEDIKPNKRTKKADTPEASDVEEEVVKPKPKHEP